MKVHITVEQTVSYMDEVVVEQPEGMSNAQFDKILETVERRMSSLQGGAADMALELESRYGIKVHSVTNNFPDNPDTLAFEVVDVDEE